MISANPPTPVVLTLVRSEFPILAHVPEDDFDNKARSVDSAYTPTSRTSLITAYLTLD
ncbi:hypothetical protein TIFTF001_036831 [Ficus carica]|uniref:Uncharacterized protein n=1 Tax=Ficus carica TaxID=3494 RepID=A0AA88JD47_FICCA|nr:hypothetical protein TIFTF001_036804 [Ficus carica]GMN67747.1 hypothetical protein TIFTF001_036816 [Ficus carica]GMN67773.1 hypothetical protein TIFTF001_036831 [Ficus carica]